MAGRKRKLSPERAVELKKLGWTHARIAAEYGITVITVYNILHEAGHTQSQKRLSHKEALPWTVAKRHQSHRIARYLRYLSTLSQGGLLTKDEHMHRYQATTVIAWAQNLIEDKKDIAYTRERGFYFKTADPSDWHLKKLMQRVTNAQIKKI